MRFAAARGSTWTRLWGAVVALAGLPAEVAQFFRPPRIWVHGLARALDVTEALAAASR